MGKSEAWLNQPASQQSCVGIAAQAPGIFLSRVKVTPGVGKKLLIPPRDTEVGVVLLLFQVAQGI